MRVLVDNSVLHHAVEHKSVWLKTRIIRMGGEDGIDVESGRQVSENSPIRIRDTKGGPQGRFIATLAISNMKGDWEAHTTDALNLERLEQPSSKFSGTGYASFSWLKKLKFVHHRTLDSFSYTLPSEESPSEKFRDFLSAQVDDVYLEIRNSLFDINESDKSNQDAWHIYCAKVLDLDHFLTCDAALLGQIKSIKNRHLRSNLLELVVLPKTLCEVLKLEGASEADVRHLFDLLGGWQ